MIKTLGLRILLSRLKKDKETEETIKKRKICAECDYNSLNMEYIPPLKRFLIMLSDLYSFVWGKLDEDNLGNCTACQSCSVYYKTNSEGEECKHPLGDKWKSIYIPNSAQKIKKQWK